MYFILLLASVVFADNDFSDFRCRCLCPPLPPVSENAQGQFAIKLLVLNMSRIICAIQFILEMVQTNQVCVQAKPSFGQI